MPRIGQGYYLNSLNIRGKDNDFFKTIIKILACFFFKYFYPNFLKENL